MRNKIKEIYEILSIYISKPEELSGRFGLYGGDFGIFLFLAIYNKHFPDLKFKHILDRFADSILESWGENPYYCTYSNGTSGILDMLCYLGENDIYRINLEEALVHLDKHLINEMCGYAVSGNYDFLHGALGPAFYLLGRNNKHKCIEDFISILHEKSIRTNNTCEWMIKFPESTCSYNISLSHGMASIVIFLANALIKGVSVEKSSEMLNGAVESILSQKYKTPQTNGSLYPSQSKEQDIIIPSRLAWCYGDLGVAVALWQAGKALKSKKIKNEAICIALNSTKRLDLNKNMIMDAGICHGTAGVAMIFRYYYDEMKLDEALLAYEYWLNRTLDMANFRNGLAGYKSYAGNNDWKNEYGLLEGVAGIGLVLLSSLVDNYSWRKIFLLM